MHNYGLKRSDGTTAAERLFAIEFPNLFSWLLEQMSELLLPGKIRDKATLNSLEITGCTGLSEKPKLFTHIFRPLHTAFFWI
ncbi:DUF6399 domain-containing protein [Methyloprofundus sedimenti]|uniref:DUF6399 domain-containing protein n=1 Tax=Methyloprofundus sedimenti TaxID=1420851 RepID=UPI0038BD2954